MPHMNACIGFLPLHRALAVLTIAAGLLAAATLAFDIPAKAVLILFCLLLGVFLITVYSQVLCLMQNCEKSKTEQQYTSDILYKQAELDALQSQINPHFLYNTLDSIRGQALAEGAEDIADMAEALSTFFRYSISNRNNVVTLDEELENAQNYFMIQQFRFNNRFSLQIPPFPRELGVSCTLPKLTLQPILENAILHGMEGKIGPGTITIRVVSTDNRTIITISDDGTGMSEETLLRLQTRLSGSAPAPLTRTKGGGIALPNADRRIKLLFGEEYGIRVMSTLGLGTDVEITLPRNEETADDP